MMKRINDCFETGAGLYDSCTVGRVRMALSGSESYTDGIQMHDDPQDQQRQRLLAELYGREVPVTVGGQLLRTADVATLFQVSERTVSDWARRGRIPSVRTPGGHRRYPAAEIQRLLEAAEHGITPEMAGSREPAGEDETDRPGTSRGGSD
jgi:excisionase family DNA binding protein